MKRNEFLKKVGCAKFGYGLLGEPVLWIGNTFPIRVPKDEKADVKEPVLKALNVNLRAAKKNNDSRLLNFAKYWISVVQTL